VVSNLGVHLDVIRQIFAWVEPDAWDNCLIDNMPGFYMDQEEKGVPFYGIPVFPGMGGP